jgi:hypothetical protein
MCELSAEYEAATKKTNAAYYVYQEVVQKYRNMEIGDDEFLAAQKVYRAVLDEFDLAYQKEQAS